MPEKIVQLNEEVIKGQLKELVRGSVEETLNELLEAEAEKLTQAARYERNEQRQGYRSGHYSRNLTTTSGDVTLKVPKLKGISATTAATSPPLPGMSPSRYPSSKGSPLRRLLLSGTAAGRAAWKRHSLRCTWPAYPSGVLRTSPRLCGAARSLPPP